MCPFKEGPTEGFRAFDARFLAGRPFKLQSKLVKGGWLYRGIYRGVLGGYVRHARSLDSVSFECDTSGKSVGLHSYPDCKFPVQSLKKP